MTFLLMLTIKKLSASKLKFGSSALNEKSIIIDRIGQQKINLLIEKQLYFFIVGTTLIDP